VSEHDLVLHVGMPRSVVVLRRALAKLRPQLRMHGVAFVGGAQIEQLRHSSGWDCGPRTREGNQPRFARELAAAVSAERRHAGGVLGRRPVQTVLSSERLLGEGHVGLRDAEQFRPYATRAVGQVIEALAARRVQVVLYTHRQDRLMELSYLKRISAGKEYAFEDEFPYRFEPVLDYLDLIDRLHAVPNVADVVVRPLELVDAGQHAFVNDFLGLLGAENALDLSAIGIDPWPYPSVYSGRGAQLALAMNPLMDNPDERRLVSRYLSKNYMASERYSTDLLDRDLRQRILDTYAERNRELFAKYLPDLPPDSYADDPSTFALGNVLSQPAPPKPPAFSVRVRAAASVTAAEALLEFNRRARPAAGRARRAIKRRVQRPR
jgi:hypothetical protein